MKSIKTGGLNFNKRLTLFMLAGAFLALGLSSSGCGATKNIVLKDKGTVNGSLQEATQWVKDVLDKREFDLDTIDEGEEAVTISAQHPEGQTATVEIDKIGENESEVTVEVSNRGREKTSADKILKEIEVRY